MSSLVSHGFLAPPTVFIVLCLLGPLIALVWRRTGLAIALASGICLFAAATPALSSYLLRRVEADIPDYDEDLGAVDAIVVLGGDIRVARGGGADELGPISLERILYAVAAYRQLHKPIAVSGGTLGRAHEALASLMRDMLETDFGIPVTWSETESTTTWQNAAFTARLLRPVGVESVLVVTGAADLPRALWSFERAGLRAIAWPVPRTAPQWDEFADFMPQPKALQSSLYALHEMIGGEYYRLCYGPQRRGPTKHLMAHVLSVARAAGQRLLECNAPR
jgi:uncharacterized SAM-binding protein YcdF (DUF218 family)